MKKLSVDLTNCYGIGRLNHEFSFSEARANLIYAPNGVMKTSLTNTFAQLSSGKEPQEKLYNRTSAYQILIDGVPVKQEEILVIEPFNPSFDSKNISTLLVNTEKKEQYDSSYKSILDAKKSLLVELNKVCKIKKDDIEKDLCSDLNCSDIFEAIRWLQENDMANNEYKDLQYSQLFDEKVISLLQDQDVIASIEEYIHRYNQLISNSRLYKIGVFNPSKATMVSSTLKKENFFDADHKVILNGNSDVITSHDEFNEIFENEKKELLADKNLKLINQKIINGVASIKTFQSILELHPEIAALLSNIDNFKKIMWSTYYAEKKDQFNNLLSLFDSNKQELINIEIEAKLEETLWYQAVDVFKERFHVPFSLGIENHTNTILGTEAPNITFSFTDDTGKTVTFNRGQLTSLDVLSIGERRAMYLLYVIFEFKARQAKGQRTIIIVDDIADSFDYKNKYAIIEYLKEIAEEELFRMLVLTHNFDFYRTFQSRVLTERSKRSTSYIAQKENEQSILLLKGGDNYISSPFDVWRKNFSDNSAIIVAMIPFVRNLVEYKDGTSSSDYMKLTSLLHIKQDTHTIRLSDLENIISSSISNTSLGASINKNELVINHIYNTANQLCNNPVVDEIRLENKVTISIAIRLKAEEFLWSKVTDKSPINGVQTGRLYDRYISEYNSNSNSERLIRKTLGQVILMTPENIHINSFMYEPLMDLSVHHLVNLYRDVSSLA